MTQVNNQNQIRVLQIVPNMQPGGLENLLMNVHRHLDASDIQFDFLVHYKTPGFFDQEIKKSGSKIFYFNLREKGNLISYIRDLNHFYKSHPEYKIIHCHMSSIGFIHFLVAMHNNVRIRIAHSHNTSTEKSLKGIIKRVMMLPYKYTSTHNYACSNAAGKYLFGRRRFTFIPNAIEIERFQYNNISRQAIRKKHDINLDALVIGHVGRFELQKNHTFILDLFKFVHDKNPQAILLLVGEGNLRQTIIEQAKSLNLHKSIRFINNVANVEDYYCAMDVFVLPSLFEGLPLTGIEAQASGLSCLFADNITSQSIQTNLVRSLPIDDPNLWSQAIINLKPNRARKRYNTQMLKTDFNIVKMTQNMANAYRSLYQGEMAE